MDIQLTIKDLESILRKAKSGHLNYTYGSDTIRLVRQKKATSVVESDIVSIYLTFDSEKYLEDNPGENPLKDDIYLGSNDI